MCIPLLRDAADPGYPAARLSHPHHDPDQRGRAPRLPQQAGHDPDAPGGREGQLRGDQGKHGVLTGGIKGICPFGILRK